MISTYLRSIEMIEMISRRLTKTQKAEILEAYIAGDNANTLAENIKDLDDETIDWVLAEIRARNVTMRGPTH